MDTLLKMVKSSLIVYGIMLLSFIPLLAPFFLVDLEKLDSMTRFNIFLLGVAGLFFIFFTLGRFLKNLNRDSLRVEFKPHWQEVILDVTAWLKKHELATFSLFIILLIVLMLPLQNLLLWANTVGVPTNLQLLIFFILALFFIIPFSLLSSLYESATKPRRATLQQVEMIMKRIYSKHEISREKLSSLRKSYVIKPNKLLSKLLVMTGIASTALIELSYYIQNQPLQWIAIFLMIGFTIIFVMMSIIGKRVSQLDDMLER